MSKRENFCTAINAIIGGNEAFLIEEHDLDEFVRIVVTHVISHLEIAYGGIVEGRARLVTKESKDDKDKRFVFRVAHGQDAYVFCAHFYEVADGLKTEIEYPLDWVLSTEGISAWLDSNVDMSNESQ